MDCFCNITSKVNNWAEFQQMFSQVYHNIFLSKTFVYQSFQSPADTCMNQQSIVRKWPLMADHIYVSWSYQNTSSCCSLSKYNPSRHSPTEIINPFCSVYVPLSPAPHLIPKVFIPLSLHVWWTLSDMILVLLECLLSAIQNDSSNTHTSSIWTDYPLSFHFWLTYWESSSKYV